MQDRHSNAAAAGDGRPTWRRWLDRAIVAAFVVLLVLAIVTPLMGIVRPGKVLFFFADTAEIQFAAAGLDGRPLLWLQVASRVVAGLVLAGAATLLFRQHRGQPVATLLSFSFLVLSISIYGVQLAGVPGLAVLASFVPEAWSLFTVALMIFPDGRFVPSWMRWVALALAVLTLLELLGLVPGYFFAPLGVAVLLVSVGALLNRYGRQPAGTERQQIRWALLGFAVGAPITILTVGIQALMGDGRMSPPMWIRAEFLVFTILLPLSHLLIAGGLLVSMLKYRLYDADRVITRSVSLSALTLILLALFTGTEKVVELLGDEWFHEEIGVLAGGLGAALAAATFVPIHHRLTHWAEHRFQKELIHLRTGLPALMADMRETAPVRRVTAAALDWITRGVRAGRAALLIDSELVDARGIDADEVGQWRVGWRPAGQDGFDIDRGDPVFPLRIPLEASGHGRVGWLLLGPRPDGSFYGKDERATLAQIADPIARALEIASRREASEAGERALWQGQQELNDKLWQSQQRVEKSLVAIEGLLKQVPALRSDAAD